MARPKNDSPRVLGPYPKRDGYQVVHIKRDGEREHIVFKTKEAADAAVARLVESLNRPEKTIREALKDYESYMRDDKGNKENSIDQTGRKLRRFFGDLDVALTDLTPEKAEALYLTLRSSRRKPQKPGTTPAPDAKAVSVDYHRNALSEAKTFLRWCEEEVDRVQPARGRRRRRQAESRQGAAPHRRGEEVDRHGGEDRRP